VGAGVAAPGLGEGRGDPTFDATCRSKWFKILTITVIIMMIIIIYRRSS